MQKLVIRVVLRKRELKLYQQQQALRAWAPPLWEVPPAGDERGDRPSLCLPNNYRLTLVVVAAVLLVFISGGFVEWNKGDSNEYRHIPVDDAELRHRDDYYRRSAAGEENFQSCRQMELTVSTSPLTKVVTSAATDLADIRQAIKGSRHSSYRLLLRNLMA